MGSPFASAATILSRHGTPRRIPQGVLEFRPYNVQRGAGPHHDGTYAYASDTKWDAFHSNIRASVQQGISISDSEGHERFGINTRWNVEGFGFGYITADNGGEFYTLPAAGETRTLNLNFELAKSRVYRNRRRIERHETATPVGGRTANGRAGGRAFKPSRDLQTFMALSEGFFEDAEARGEEQRRAELAQKALFYALHAGEMMEIEAAQHAITRQREDFFIGCDAKAFYLMRPETFMERFTEVFNFANVTFGPRDRVMGGVQPELGNVQFDRHDVLIHRLRDKGVTVGGRMLFWFHNCCTPDYMRDMSFDELKKHVERTTRETLTHFGDRIYAWELMNELHDWANVVELSPEQTIEITRLACDVAKDTAPNIHRLINNCCPFAEYVQMGTYSSGKPARYPQRTPWEFTRDLIDAGVDFTLIGQQLYFPWRDLQDIIVFLERFEEFGKPVQISEIGVHSGPTERSVALKEKPEIPDHPPIWRRHWDVELQADWLEAVFTLAYSRPWIEAAAWFDLLDYPAYIKNGGLLSSPRGEKKPAFHRLKRLEETWAALSR